MSRRALHSCAWQFTSVHSNPPEEHLPQEQDEKISVLSLSWFVTKVSLPLPLMAPFHCCQFVSERGFIKEDLICLKRGQEG